MVVLVVKYGGDSADDGGTRNFLFGKGDNTRMPFAFQVGCAIGEAVRLLVDERISTLSRVASNDSFTIIPDTGEQSLRLEALHVLEFIVKNE